MSKSGILLGAGIAAAAVETGIAGYFFRRTMIRGNAKEERTTKMAGTDWNQYLPEIRKKKDWVDKQDHEAVSIIARDGLRLKGHFYPGRNPDKVILCLHGYTSRGSNDFNSLAYFYLHLGYSLLIVDHRSHGESEGTYIGFGCLDRFDVVKWIRYLEKRCGKNCLVMLHGISMGGATALMVSGLSLPGCVKGIVSDCGFTSAWEVFDSVLKNTYHLPSFPILQIADVMAKREAGYGLNECNALNEVAKSTVPILFIHGDADTFVPSWMCHKLYKACKSRKEMLVVKGAAHAESYYKSTEKYEIKVKDFLNSIMEEGL